VSTVEELEDQLGRALFRARVREADPTILREALLYLGGANLSLAEMALRVAVMAGGSPRHKGRGVRRPRLIRTGQHGDPF
jgi:hypothetical protein